MEQRGVSKHKCEWVETGRQVHDQGTDIQYKCEGCGGLMARGPGRVITEDEMFKQKVVAAIIADIKNNGPICEALKQCA